MKPPLQVKFRNMPRSQAVEENIREKASKLESFYDRIMGCRVIVAAPHRHHRKGKVYEVRIDLTVPGGELVINRSAKRLKTAGLAVTDGPETQLIESHEPGKHGARADVYVAVRDAFNAAGRKLQTTRDVRVVPLSCMRVGPERAAPSCFLKKNIVF